MNSLLPPNASAQERALEAATARLGDVPVPLAALWYPATCPAALLPWLAWALSVDHWKPGWSTAVKRSVIAESVKLHRHKGTPWAVERALIISGAPNATVTEWWEYGGDPGYFKVLVGIDGGEVSGSLETDLLDTIDRFKNVRSWLELLEYNLAISGAVPVIACSLHSSEIVTIYPQ